MKSFTASFLLFMILNGAFQIAEAQTVNWTWIGGDSVLNSAGSYGTLDSASPGNQPHSRYTAYSWKDLNGDFWLFGGFPWCDDLWKYNVAANEWTWMGGDKVLYVNGIYGTLRSASP